MAIGRGGISKRGAPGHVRAFKPAGFRTKRNASAGKRDVARWVARRRAEAAERKANARKAILSFYRKDWSCLPQGARVSRSSIATELLRRQITTYKNQKQILLILEELEKAGRLKLPKKQTRRIRKKKRKKKR